ncbi:MAG TPA: NAD-dependent epimerase/dehydratase family protein [Candidatus Methanoperedenaceae archaeon]|nr:NAD-dependent epimerase/dehydratase family protein [Candidatus Methanoperedenaceae archaeon]
MKILVTGGAGFVGSHLTDALVSIGHDVTVYDNFEPQVHTGEPGYLNEGATYVNADIRDEKILAEQVSEADIIFHQAAMVGVGQSMYQISKYMDVNTLGTAGLLDLLASKEHDVKKLIVASSMSIYGEGKYRCPQCGDTHPKLRSDGQLKRRIWELQCPECASALVPVPTDENKALQPTSVYAISKRDQDEMCLVVGRAYGIPTVALRYFNIYGPRQALSNPYTGVCAIFASRIKNGTPPMVFEDGLQTRDFVSVHDIVQANILVMENAKADYNVFNVGTGKPVSILGIAKTLSGLYQKNLEPHVTNKYRAGDVRHCYADITRIKKLGYAPKVSFGEGMAELVDWGMTQDASDKSDAAYDELRERGLVGD